MCRINSNYLPNQATTKQIFKRKNSCRYYLYATSESNYQIETTTSWSLTTQSASHLGFEHVLTTCIAAYKPIFYLYRVGLCCPDLMETIRQVASRPALNSGILGGPICCQKKSCTSFSMSNVGFLWYIQQNRCGQVMGMLQENARYNVLQDREWGERKTTLMYRPSNVLTVGCSPIHSCHEPAMSHH